MNLKQSTAVTRIVGPVLDSQGAIYAGMLIGDFNLAKNGTIAAMAATATATHDHNGYYKIAMTIGNTDTIGGLEITCNKATYTMPVSRWDVLSGAVYDVLYGTTAPSTYAGGDTAGTTTLLTRLSAARAGYLDNLSVGPVALSSDMATLLNRLTSSRAGYLDNLNVGGAVASHSDIDALNQSASRRIIITSVRQYERPESGSSSYTIEARTYDGDGAAVAADSTPTLTATGIITGTLAANLGTATSPTTGVYRWNYSVASTATIEQVRFDVSADIASSTFTLSHYSQVVDEVSRTWTNTDATHLTAIYDALPSASGAIAGKADTDALSIQLGTSGNGASIGDAIDVAINEANQAHNIVANALTGNVALGVIVDGIKAKTDNLPASPATEENVTSVGTAVSSVYTNLGLPSGASTISAMIVAVKADTNTLLGRITSTLFSGITSLANWLGAFAGKTADTETRSEINATTAGEGFNETTDSMQALRDNYTTGGDTLVVAPLRAIVPSSLIPISGTMELFQYGPLPYQPITLVQGDGVTPINVSARNLKLIMVSNQNPTTVGYELTSLGEQLVVTGTDSNLVGIVAPGPTYTSVAGDFTWNLRDADTDEGLAWGIFRIMAMANAAPS